MQATPTMPPVVAVAPGGLPASICTGLPELLVDKIKHCVFGLRITGDPSDLDKAKAKLGADGWSVELGRISPTQHVLMVDAERKSLIALKTIQDRVRSGAFGALQVSVEAIPLPAQVGKA